MKLLVIILVAAYAIQVAVSTTYLSLYENSVNAYNNGRWFECFTEMQNALADYKTFHEGLIQCRLECRKASLVDINSHNFVDAIYLDVANRRSQCIKNCTESRFPGRQSYEDNANAERAKEIEQEFASLNLYDYLQICAYKSDQFEQAISSAYTFLLSHPNHEHARSNVDYYRKLPQAHPSFFRNLEMKQYQQLRTLGIEAYNRDDWPEAVKFLEEALQQYYAEELYCSAECEAALDLPDFLNFYQQAVDAKSDVLQKQIIAEHWLEILKCKEQCPRKLATIDGELVEKFFVDQYNYLQFSYYKLGEIEKSIICTTTYLLFDPTDSAMLFNKDYYSKLDGVKQSDFVPRDDAKRYFDEKQFEAELYRLSQSRLLSRSNELQGDASGPLSSKTASIYGPRDEEFLKSFSDYQTRHGVKIVAEGDALKGANRVAVDGIISDEQCQQLIHLATVGAVQGDGYKGTESRSSPHTEFEKFEGITVGRAAELARDGVVPVDDVKLYLGASESGRSFLERYYNLQVPLLFQYTHLVCRTARQDISQSERIDLSHPVHADNCYFQPDGSCPKQAPAYYYRDFTGLIYLNDDFEGGNFFFAYPNLTVEHTVRPKCGRFVGFDSSDYHGVLPVTFGRRCALAMWYTLSPVHQELSHAEAQTILRVMENESKREFMLPSAMQYLNDKNYIISMTEADLNGKERFAADNVATEEDCQELIKLANNGGTIGSGYSSVSPHTHNEKFVGLMVSRVAQTGGLMGDGYTESTSKGSPHTNHEVFEGLTVLRASELAAEHKVNTAAVKLYLKLSRDALELTKQLLVPDKELYFSFTHLVCRTALNDKNLDRKDLSHPIHSDNCIIQPDNSCKRERPAYTERDYSAIVYLNDNFYGGDFFFAHQNMTIQSLVKPKCGRVVAFNASHYHGVRPVLSGQRCALAIWFTLDPRYDETSHVQAWNVVSQLGKRAFGPDQHAHVEL